MISVLFINFINYFLINAQNIKKGGKIMEKRELKKEIGLFDAIAIVIGVVIGSGIFFKPSMVFGSAGSATLGILAWLVGGTITMASALTVAEIASAIPKTGGAFVYLKELYGERWAFLYGWVQAVLYVPGSTAALAIILATQVTYFLPMTEFTQKVFAVGMLLFVMILNFISTKLSSKIQFAATIGKLIPIVAIIVFGFIKGSAHDFTAISLTTKVGAAGFGAAILGTLWAYDGWIGIANIAGELKRPKKDLPRAIVIGVITTIIVYIAINVAIINIMPMSSVIASKKAASDAATILFGNKGASFIAAGILISIFGTLNGYLMTGVRIPYAMGKDRIIPFSDFFSKINDKFQTPLNSYIFTAVLACLYVISGSFDMLTNLAIFTLWIFFTMTVAGVFILRKKFSQIERTYKTPLYPIVPLIGVIGGIYIIISTLITQTSNAMLGIVITLLGFPVYEYVKRKQK